MTPDPGPVADRFVTALMANPMDRSQLVGLVVPERRMDFSNWESIRGMLALFAPIGLNHVAVFDEADRSLAAVGLFENVSEDSVVHVDPIGQVNLRWRPEYGGW